MEKLDKKILKKMYNQFTKNADLYVNFREIGKQLKLPTEKLNKSVDRLIYQRLCIFRNNELVELTQKGIEEGKKLNIKFYKKINWLGIASYIIVFLLGLFAEEIKNLILKLFEK